MHDETHMLIVKKKRRISISKDLNAVQSWSIIRPIIAQEIAPDYTPIPHCLDTNAYKIGHIFVPIGTQITCFRSVSVLKILGSIHDFVVKNETSSKGLDKGLHTVRTSGDQMDFRIIVEYKKNKISFTGHDYYFLNKTYNILTQGNVMINRAAHENLLNTKWIGLITNVVVTRNFDLHIVRQKQERVLDIGDKEHTILFKYEICKIDPDGTIVNSEAKKIRCKWLPIGDKEPNSLPLSECQSTNKTR